MITCNLKGGIGNLMFQIAALEYIALQNNFKTFYYNANNYLNKLNKELKHNPKLKHAFEYKDMFENFHWTILELPKNFNMLKIPFHYTKISPQDNIIYDGFFQSEKYFPNKKFILNLFKPSEKVNLSLKKYEYLNKFITIAIHVRRGDFLKLKHIHPPQTKEYYNNAIKLIEKDFQIDKYIFFSDDINWCKNNFKNNKSVFIENEKDYVEIFLQSKCNHNIISNSSFSWWGAYLNENKIKKIISPNIWFANNNYSDKDIIPNSWSKI